VGLQQPPNAARPQNRAGLKTRSSGPHTNDHNVTRRTEILQTAASLIASSGLRTSLEEIAQAAGIRTGSLYHHFESKDAILVELIRAYHADLDRIGETAQEKLDEPRTQPISEKIVELGSAIAQCAVRHRAALQMSFYEAPSSHQELIGLLAQRPNAIQQAMLHTLRAGRWSGYIRDDIDLPTLADRISQTMLHVGLDVIRHNADPDQVAGVLCGILLEGLATRSPSDEELDRSAALAAADEVIRTWTEELAAETSDRAAEVRAVARAEFGRKGYEVTTSRDIASAAGLSTGTVYRLIGSKEELLASIMRTFGTRIGSGYDAVLRADATPVEKLDALSWVNIQALHHFPDEWKIQLAWMRQSPPDTPNPGLAFTTALQELRTLLSTGRKAGEIHIDSRRVAMVARCVIDLLWMPENIVRANGTRAALIHARDTLLRGVANRNA
jgi:AcrR family transcriptional regulator